MKHPMTPTTKRAIFAIFAFCVIAAFNILKHEMPVVKNMPVIAVFLILSILGIYFALTDKKSSLLSRASALVTAVGFSFLSIVLSGSFGLAIFNLANWRDIMSVSILLVTTAGLVINGKSGRLR